MDGEVRPATVRVEAGLVVAIGDGAADHDFGDLLLMPGLVDTHVHVNEPGRTHWEGFATATAAAVAGGCTTIVDMPLNSVPPTVTVQALEEKREAAKAGLGCDVAFWGGFVGPLDQLGPLTEAGVCGFKSFLVDSGVAEFPPVSPDELGAAMAIMARLAVPALVHAEDPDQLRPLGMSPGSYRGYLESRPVTSELEAIRQVAGLAETTGAQAHILHVSSGEAAEAIGRGPGNLSGETCPHYLTFSAEEIPDGATLFKCTPPIREAEHREALWHGLESGWVSMVVSDHSPAPVDLKNVDTGDFTTAWGGISSLQLRLLATWTGASERGHGPLELTEWLSAAPARLAGLGDRKGAIAIGMDGDLVAWDQDRPTDVAGSALRHRHPATPYEGMRLRGRVSATVLGGHIVFPGNGAMERRGRMLARR